MITKRIIISLIVLQIFVITSCGQASVNIPKEFGETIPPKAGSDEWYPLNYSHNEFSVKIFEGKLDINKVREVNKSELKITGETLIGINKGEWGGQLRFQVLFITGAFILASS